ncbi:hypothetical protein BGX34_001275 [Mortierella sp. NVP85]|nr:hypothetical protein BGX34_001275 [Mortierella sp. NVP85]
MFDDAEIHKLICRQLEPHDLAQCARVNKKWHKAALPFLWLDLSCLEGLSDTQQQAFCDLILEDYHRYHELHEERGTTNQQTRTQPSPPSILEKYGPWVQKLPSPGFFRLLFQECGKEQHIQEHSASITSTLAKCHSWARKLRSPGSFRSIFRTSQQTAHGMSVAEATALGAIRHIYKHCQVQYLALDKADLESDELLKTLTEFAVPHVRSLVVKSRSVFPGLESWRLKYLLNHCSNALEDLTLNVNIYYEDQRSEEQDKEEPSPWMLLKRLRLERCGDKSGSRAFWSWLWKKCDKVELLRVEEIGEISDNLVEGIVTHMPNLDKIHLEGLALTNEEIVALLASSRHGWKEVRMEFLRAFEASTKEVLMRHCSTVERLELIRCSCIMDNQKIQILASNPKLCDFIDLRPGGNWTDWTWCFRASTFIDQDPSTGSLREWSSESSIKTLKIKITDIPRPDIHPLGKSVVEETYPGQGREIQGRVYDRLSRLTNLETLWLGGESSKWILRGCLEMSMDSGLHRLSGLKSLKELNVSFMRTRIGVKEVQWMTEQWPKLRIIYGLQEAGRSKRPVEWLQQYHPEICLK